MRNTPRTFGTFGTWAACRAVLGFAVLAGAAPAHADELSGSYEVKFEQISTNCEHPLAYPQQGTVKIEVKGADLQVEIDRTPRMVGKSKPGKVSEPWKVSAKSPKAGHTPIEGMDGMFSVAGRVATNGMLSLVMVGEYQTAGRPLCTQSWNLSGARPDKADKPDKPDKSDKPKK
jgi:hypothetical protein